MALNMNILDPNNQLTDDEDFMEIALLVAFSGRCKIIRQLPDHFEIQRDFQCVERFRLTENTVRFIVDKLRDTLFSPTNW